MPPSDGQTIVHLAEFIALADRLHMPVSERKGILGVSDAGWPAISATRIDSAEVQTKEFRRRLDYVLPLMRIAVANCAGTQPVIGPDRPQYLS